MTTLLISDFKARCLAIIEKVHSDGESVLVTRRGKPLVRVMPATERPAGSRKLGALAGEAVANGDIVHTSFEHEWESRK
jgi:prevent-host-death family protein